MIKCKSCHDVLDVPGCDDASRSDQKRPEFCRACASFVEDEEKYQAHLRAGGRPYEARMSGPNGRILARDQRTSKRR